LVILLSCSSQFVAGFIAQHLDTLYSCTFLRVEDNRLVGEPAGEVCYGLGKFRVAHAISRSWDIPLSCCTFYSDSYSDRFLLESVGHPIVVNPDLGLSLLAIHNRWNVFRF
jgi:phosphoserine phosphatase